jgi:putative DNA primase/helicase
MIMKKKTITPEDNGEPTPDPLQIHLDQLTSKEEPIPHVLIMNRLLEEIPKIDYQAIAYPQVIALREALDNPEISKEDANAILDKIEKLKVNFKHYLVITIEQLNKTAESQNWGLCKNHDFVYAYNSEYWMQCDEEEFRKFLGEAAERMGVPIFDARLFTFRDQLYKQFFATSYLSAPSGNIDKALINMKNGTFEVTINGTELRPFDPQDFITYQLPFDYDPEAKAPRWQKFLDEVLPDMQRQHVLAEFLGYVFIKHGGINPKEEKALVLYGPGGNGKSVVYEVVNAMLGFDNVSNYSLQSLTNESGYFRANLANKLVNYASEINGKLESSIFKLLVSGEPVEARLPYGQPFILKQYAKLIFNCNELPKDVEHTNAYFRRYLIIPFDVTIPKDKQDKLLHMKIISTELSGVFNWVLDGLRRMLNQGGFSDCEAAAQALEQYKTESNTVKLFLDERGYETSIAGYMLIKELYAEYRLFCYDDGSPPFKKVNFSKQLISLNVRIDRQPGTGQKIAYVAKTATPKEI